ncbi:MAG: PAS-domain containing protein [Alphaproteobacteria bacterium]|nr:PAS-domain containing protein [Alphaproteobacteria bacterium]
MNASSTAHRFQKKSLFDRWLKPTALLAERNRLEAFLAAFPGEYCGFNPDGSLAYSKGFLSLLNLQKINGISDIQHALRPGDAAALETCYIRLKEQRQNFVLKAQTTDQTKILRLTGGTGTAISGTDQYDIIWVEDITVTEKELESKRSAQNVLEHEIKKYRAVLGAITYPVWIYNPTGELIWCNDAYAHILGVTPDIVLFDKKEVLFTTPKRKGKIGKPVKILLEDALASGQIQSEPKHVIIQGDRKMMQVSLIPLPHLDIVIGQAQDISREEEIETRSERNMAANRELLEQLRTAIAIFDGEQKLEFYNSSYAQLWRLEEGWLNAHPKLGDILERLRETRRLPEQADFKRYKQGWLELFTSQIGPKEDMLYLPDGSVLRSLVVPHPLGGLLMTFEDVTSGLELESSYNTLMAVQKETLDGLTEGVAVYGSNGRLTLWNPAYASMWALNPEDLDGKLHITQILERSRAFFPADDWDKQRDQMTRELFSRQDKKGEIRRTDGRILHYVSVALPDGGTMVTFHDVTDTVRVEEALREKATALETAERLKLDFLANVSYQLRTPLNAIIGFNEILDKEYFGELNNRQKEYTKGLAEASEQLMNLINDILDLSTIEAGYMTINKEAVNVASMLTALYDLTQEWARGQKIEVTLSLSDQIGIANLDERRIKQGLLNLLRNAIAYTPAGGRIRLSASRVDDQLALSVTDTGPGIAPEDQARIFKPFEKTGLHREEGRTGAGLGLSLVQNIVNLHGGRIELESTLGEGTTITLLLPSQ